jgi:hypothetical protein
MNINKKYMGGGLNKKMYQNSGKVSVMSEEEMEAVENQSEKEDADIVKAFQEGGKLDANTDKLNFEQAFSHYRDKLGPGQRFMWKGRPYSTNTQEEVLEMQMNGGGDNRMKVLQNLAKNKDAK